MCEAILFQSVDVCKFCTFYKDWNMTQVNISSHLRGVLPLLLSSALLVTPASSSADEVALYECDVATPELAMAKIESLRQQWRGKQYVVFTEGWVSHLFQFSVDGYSYTVIDLADPDFRPRRGLLFKIEDACPIVEGIEMGTLIPSSHT